MDTALLILGVAALLATVCTVFRLKHSSLLVPLVMFAGWLGGELALFHIVAQVVVTAILVALGALDSASGWIGLIAMGLSIIGLVYSHRVAGGARDVFIEALAPDYPAAARAVAQRQDVKTPLRPFSYDKSGIALTKDLAYGPEKRHRLDVYAPLDADGPLPILLYIHGGAWIIGNKEQQAMPLLHAAPHRGFIGITINYRLGPRTRFPSIGHDVQLALDWVRDNPDAHGGDVSRIVLCGGSAGGHLASLTALNATAGDGVVGCVPYYGVFDFTDHLGLRGYANMRLLLERMVMSTKLSVDKALWEATSPLLLTRSDAPPFFVIQGSNDVLVWREEAQAFVERLREVSTSPVVYAELPGAQHAFDIFYSVRSLAAVDATLAFCQSVVSDESGAG